jgi:hypothetical protein
MTRGVAILACACAQVIVAAQSAQVPGRDGPAGLATGTAVIAGTLLTDEPDPRPVRRATVGATVQTGRRPVMTVTDDNGRFTLRNLPAGAYILSATKPSFVTAYYGAKRPGRGPGVPVVVANGQRVEIAMKMLRGAVITGQVFDQRGQPAANADFQLLQFRIVNGQRILAGAYGGFGYASTDDRGFYRAYGLAPGEYLVAVTGRTYADALRETTASDIQWAERQFGAVAAGPPSAAPPALPANPRLAGVPIYFPGTADLSRAQFVTVGPGEERTGVNFSIHYMPTARIEGIVIDADGRPSSNSQVSLVVTSMVPGDYALSSSNVVTVTNGRFVLNGIGPGRFTLMARATMASEGGAGRGSAAPTHWALHDLTVAGRDIDGIELRLERGLTVSGRIVVDGTTTPPPDFARVRMQFQSLQTPSGITLNVPAGPVSADGSFVITGLVPGRYRLTAQALAAPWFMKSAMVGTVDALDVPVEIGKGDASAVTATLSDRPAELFGTVVDAAGRPTPEYSIIVFSTDRATWLTNARRTRAMRLTSAGTFSMTGLPAGEYFLCAATDYEPSDLGDPAFLAELAAASVRVTLSAGERLERNLKVAR